MRYFTETYSVVNRGLGYYARHATVRITLRSRFTLSQIEALTKRLTDAVGEGNAVVELAEQFGLFGDGEIVMTYIARFDCEKDICPPHKIWQDWAACLLTKVGEPGTVPVLLKQILVDLGVDFCES